MNDYITKFLEDHPDNIPRLKIFQQLLSFFPLGRLIDLGTAYGEFAITAADKGWDVVATDARKELWPDDSRIEWIQQDVRETSFDGYDLILCLGLFYHLTLQDQLNFLRKCSGTPLILDTHMRPALEQEQDDPKDDYYYGRVCPEDGTVVSSWGNEESFWPTYKSLKRMLLNNGYKTILVTEPFYWPDRTFFLCLGGE